MHWQLDKTKKALSEIKTEKDKSDKDHEVHVNELVGVFNKYKTMGDDLALEQQKEIEQLRKELENVKLKVSAGP